MTEKTEHIVLYRKYRPRDFDEVVSQEHVVEPIRNAIRTNRLAHAYLFAGPRGVGKTTMARLIAKAANCEGKGNKEKPCNKCSFCEDFNANRSMNLTEIDAASNRGIDEIRELRENVRFIPASGAYKTYVIDECHMLTKEAFNALLKTLEEPPKHAIFILATTDLEKVPATIVSRTQHYDFRRPTVAEIAKRLKMIAKKEGAILEDDASLLIAFAAEGALRDAESILGQVIAVQDERITREEVEGILGLPPRQAAQKMFEFIAKKNAPAAITLIQELAEAGHDFQYFAKLLMQYFRAAVFLKADASLKRFIESELLPEEYETIAANLDQFGPGELTAAITTIFENTQRFRRTPIPQLPLEITVIDLIRNKKPDPA